MPKPDVSMEEKRNSQDPKYISNSIKKVEELYFVYAEDLISGTY